MGFCGWRPRALALSQGTRSLLQRWGNSFGKDADLDAWGQGVEATEEYQILARYLQKGPKLTTAILNSQKNERKPQAKIAAGLELGSAAILFGFKHYRPKKWFTSPQCCAFVEMDEIKPGPMVRELYKKSF